MDEEVNSKKAQIEWHIVSDYETFCLNIHKYSFKGGERGNYNCFAPINNLYNLKIVV